MIFLVLHALYKSNRLRLLLGLFSFPFLSLFFDFTYFALHMQFSRFHAHGSWRFTTEHNFKLEFQFTKSTQKIVISLQFAHQGCTVRQQI